MKLILLLQPTNNFRRSYVLPTANVWHFNQKFCLGRFLGKQKRYLIWWTLSILHWKQHLEILGNNVRNATKVIRRGKQLQKHARHTKKHNKIVHFCRWFQTIYTTTVIREMLARCYAEKVFFRRHATLKCNQWTTHNSRFENEKYKQIHVQDLTLMFKWEGFVWIKFIYSL